MSRYDAETRQFFIDGIREALESAGFTGIGIASGPMPEPSRDALRASQGEDDDEIPFDDPSFADELAYHRVRTDQGEFGVWLEPYVTLDLSGLGLDIQAFLPGDTRDEAIPPGWSFIGLDEGVLEKLYVELEKKRRQP